MSLERWGQLVMATIALDFRVTIHQVAPKENMKSELATFSSASFKCNIRFFIKSLHAVISTDDPRVTGYSHLKE